jgi:hypothetical protein
LFSLLRSWSAGLIVSADQVDEREEKIQRVISILKARNLARYGVDAVDEAHVRRMSDRSLDRVIDPYQDSCPIVM